jgi:hypothetical protein
MFNRDEVLKRALTEEKVTLDNVEAYILHGQLPEQEEPGEIEEGIDEGLSARERMKQLGMSKMKAKDAIAKMKQRSSSEKGKEHETGFQRKSDPWEGTSSTGLQKDPKLQSLKSKEGPGKERKSARKKKASNESVMAELRTGLLEYMATWDERARERTAQMMGVDLPSPEDRARMRSAAETTYMRSVSRPVSRYTGMTFRTGS